jgi:hypothetical protein
MTNDITSKLGNFLSWENAEEAIKEIEFLRKEAADWKQTAQMLAMDLGKIEYAAAVYDDVQSGLYEKVRERIKSIEQ